MDGFNYSGDYYTVGRPEKTMIGKDDQGEKSILMVFRSKKNLMAPNQVLNQSILYVIYLGVNCTDCRLIRRV